MKTINTSYDYDAAGSVKTTPAVTRLLQHELQAMAAALKNPYGDPHGSLCCPFDKQTIARCVEVATKQRRRKLGLVILVGIGGSNLGTIAVLDGLRGAWDGFLSSSIRFVCADTVDSDRLHAMIAMMEQTLRQGKEVLINVVSKSGTTTETIANYEVLLKTLQRYRTPWASSVVVTTDAGSPLCHYAERHGCDVLEIPSVVGGRYSVFSPVGLFPLAVLGIDVHALLGGATRAISDTLRRGRASDAVKMAQLLVQQAQKGRKIHNVFIFHSDLESFGRWYRQLLAESLGKDHGAEGRKRSQPAGIQPLVSIGSTDLHSQAQLYLAGPDLSWMTFIHVEETAHPLKVPQFREFETIVHDLQGQSFTGIMHAILEGTLAAFRRRRRPYVVMTVPKVTPASLGYVMQQWMMMVMIAGKLLNINPFDQPAVEEYKNVTRRLLHDLQKGGSRP